MWIPKVISESGASEPFTAEITGADSGSVQLGGSIGEAFLPYGVVSIPPKGTKAAAFQAGRTLCICGCENCGDIELEPGETAIYSKGGASVVLKNDGRVLINGREIV